MLTNGIQDDEAEIGPIDDDMEGQDQDGDGLGAMNDDLHDLKIIDNYEAGQNEEEGYYDGDEPSEYDDSQNLDDREEFEDEDANEEGEEEFGEEGEEEI